MNTIFDNMKVIQDLISRGKISKIEFIISEPEPDLEGNMPVIDYCVEGENGRHLVSDLGLESMEEAIDYIVKDLSKKALG